MKKSIIIAVMAVISIATCTAQNLNDKVYFDEDWNVIADASKASYYRLYNANDKSTGLKPYKDFYINDILQGEGYYSKISKIDGEIDFIEEGEQKNYYESGKLREKWYKKNGDMHGEDIMYYENGNLMYQTYYENGKPNGKYTKYDSTGTIDRVFNYKHGILDGKQVQYAPDNRAEIWKEDYFNNGLMEKEITYSHGSVRKTFTLISRENDSFIANVTWYLSEDEDPLISKRSIDYLYDFDPEIWEYAFQLFYVETADFNGEISQKHGKYQSFDKQGRIITDGQYSYGKKIGKWTNNLYSQNCYYIDDYDNVNNTTRYYTFDNKPITGIVTQDETEGVKIDVNIKNGIRCGKYTAYHYDDDGEIYMKYYGNYDNLGQPDGYFHAELLFGSEWKTVDYSNYIHGVKHGEWRTIEGDSIIFKNYNNGELDGEYLIKIANSKEDLIKEKDSLWHKITKGTYKNGRKTGHWWMITDREWELYQKEGNFIDGMEEGEWIFYGMFSTDGYFGERQIEAIINFHEGKREGKAIRFKNKANMPFKDSIFVVGYFKNDELDGPYEKHDNDGNISVKGNYSNGKETGVWTYTYSTEKIYRTSNPDDDNIPDRFYTIDGKPFTGTHTETFERDDDSDYDTVVVTVKNSLIQQVDFIDSATGKVIYTNNYKNGLLIKE
ncbi:MAG: hypothetical protein J6Z01_00780 [Bacteroidales bacterium]|nr:hypothetical protein [Bacteroidales bacterium]